MAVFNKLSEIYRCEICGNAVEITEVGGDELICCREKWAGRTPMQVGIRKEYLQRKNLCRVTFWLPKLAAPDAKSASVVGDFNDWNVYADRMRKLKNGDLIITLELRPGREYEFQYLIDETKWENDGNADKYVKSPYGDGELSVIVV